MKVGILLPAYNEEKNIKLVIEECKKYFKGSEIVVINDGSTDKTEKIAKKTKVTVISHTKNLGKGEALKTGLKYFSKRPVNFILIADADRQYSIKDLKKLLNSLSNVDFVMGYRNFSRIPFRHRFGNLVWRSTFNFLFGTNFKDTNCGLMGLSKKIIKKIRIGKGYTAESYILASIVKNKIKFTQVPVNVKYKKISSIGRGVKTVFTVLAFIIKEGIKFRLKLTNE